MNCCLLVWKLYVWPFYRWPRVKVWPVVCLLIIHQLRPKQSSHSSPRNKHCDSGTAASDEDEWGLFTPAERERELLVYYSWMCWQSEGLRNKCYIKVLRKHTRPPHVRCESKRSIKSTQTLTTEETWSIIRKVMTYLFKYTQILQK